MPALPVIEPVIVWEKVFAPPNVLLSASAVDEAAVIVFESPRLNTVPFTVIEAVPHVVPPIALSAVTKLFEAQALAPPKPETAPVLSVRSRADFTPLIQRDVVEAFVVEKFVVVAFVNIFPPVKVLLSVRRVEDAAVIVMSAVPLKATLLML